MSIYTRALRREKRRQFKQEREEGVKPVEYRQHYVDKISQETTVFAMQYGGLWKDAKQAMDAMWAFTKRRIKHYGLNNRYLPPTFKRKLKQEETDGSNTDGIAAESLQSV